MSICAGQFLLIIIFLLTSIIAWDLSSIGLKNTTYNLRYLSRSYIRVFLSIESQNKSIKIPTLIETTWPENFLSLRPKFFPNIKEHAHNPKQCSKIQQAGWSDIDDFGRLWLLDIGNNNCYSKLILYDLTKNLEIHREICPFRYDSVISMKLADFGITFSQYVALFTFNHGKYIWMFYYLRGTWKKMKFYNKNYQRINVQEITFTFDIKLYLTDKYGQLYTTDFPFHLNQTKVTANKLGTLLGTPNYLITDGFGKIYYNLPKYGAVVRFKPHTNLIIEEHEILLLQSVPIVQIFFGIRGTVWVAFEKMISYDDHCERILYHFAIKSEFS